MAQTGWALGWGFMAETRRFYQPVSINGPLNVSGKIGYPTGSGGAVTQATNRTTGVTINTVAGTITKVDAATGLIDIKPLEGKAITIKSTKDSAVKKLPAMMAAMMGGGGMRGPGGPGGPGGAPGGAPRGEGGGRPAGAPGGGAPGEARGPGGPGAGGPGAGGAGAGPGAGMFGGGGRGGGDLNAMLERMPSLPLTDLKVGDQIIVSSTKGAAAEQMTAITILTGVEALLAARPAAAPQGGRGGGMGSWSMDIPVL